jgi:hypothetical protein
MDSGGPGDSRQAGDGLELDGVYEVMVESRSPGLSWKPIWVLTRRCNDEDILHFQVAPHLLGKLKAVQPGKTEIPKDDIGPVGSGGSQGRQAIVDGLDLETGAFPEERQAPGQVSMILRMRMASRRPKNSIDDPKGNLYNCLE